MKKNKVGNHTGPYGKYSYVFGGNNGLLCDKNGLYEYKDTMKKTKIKYTKKMKDFLLEYGITVKPVKYGKFTPELIQFLQDQNDEYEFTTEGVPMDPLFNMNGSNPYVGSGSMEDIPYDDVEDMYMD